ASPVIPGATYSWKVWYGVTGANNYHTQEGAYITTPSIAHWGILPYYIRWELTITTSCGSKVLKGTKNNWPFQAPMIGKPATFMEADSLTFYLETRFTENDSLFYENTIESLVASKFVEDP